MEPRNDETTTVVRLEARPSRFRIDRLEERIAPKKHGSFGCAGGTIIYDAYGNPIGCGDSGGGGY